MLRKIAAGTSAAVVAAGLAAAPAVASGLPASPGDSCGDVTQTEHTSLDQQSTRGFVFGPLADVPHLLSGDRTCFTVASEVADMSGARRHSAAPPPVGTPVPEVPASPPPGDSGPGAPGPGDSAPPPSADSSSLPAPPDFTPVMAPPLAEAGPPPSPRAELGGPGESVLPSVQPPRQTAPRLPQTASDTRPLTVAGGGSLFAAGLAWIAGARRRRKRPAGPAAGD
jgi:LPXTG-motif cell wall-anchored protein